MEAKRFEELFEEHYFETLGDLKETLYQMTEEELKTTLINQITGGRLFFFGYKNKSGEVKDLEF